MHLISAISHRTPEALATKLNDWWGSKGLLCDHTAPYSSPWQLRFFLKISWNHLKVFNDDVLNIFLVNVRVLVMPSTFLLDWAGEALKLCSVLNGITQCYLPPTRYIHARVEQDSEHNIRNKLLDVAAYFTDLRKMKAWVELSVPGFEPGTTITLREWTHSCESWCLNQLS